MPETVRIIPKGPPAAGHKLDRLPIIDENRPFRLRIFENFLESFKRIVLDGRMNAMI